MHATHITDPGPSGPKHADAATLAQRALDRLLQQFAEKGGVTKEKLGAEAGRLVKELAEELLREAKRGPVASVFLTRASQRLRVAHALDVAGKFNPGKIPAKSSGTQIPAKHAAAPVAGTPGRFQLAVADDHLLAQLFRISGLNPRSFGQHVHAVVEWAAGNRKLTNLGDANAWRELARALKREAIRDGEVAGVPKPAQLERADAKVGAHRSAQRAPAASVADLGLHKSAPRATGTGSKNGAVATQARLFSAFNRGKATLEETAAGLLREFVKWFGAEGVGAAVKKDILGALKSVLADRGSADGSLRPLAILGNAFRLLVSRTGDDRSKGIFAVGVDVADMLLRGASEKKFSGEAKRAFSRAALSAVGDVVASMLGKEPRGLGEATRSALAAALRSLPAGSPTVEFLAEALSRGTGQGVGEGAGISEGAEPAEYGAASARERARVSEGSEAAEKGTAAAGSSSGAVSAGTPRGDAAGASAAGAGASGAGASGAGASRASATGASAAGASAAGAGASRAGATGAGAAAGAASGAGGAVEEMARRVLANLGVEPSHPQAGALRDVLQALIAQGRDPTSLALNAAAYLGDQGAVSASELLDIRALVRASQAAIDRLESKRTKLLAERDDLTGRIDTSRPGEMKRRLEKSRGKIERTLDSIQGEQATHAERILVFTQHLLQAIRDHVLETPLGRSRAEAARSAEGAEERASSPGRPGETEAKHRTREDRAHKCATIFGDPSLCIEDKIFLLMMWFAHFSDRDREDKLDEIIAMDTNDAKKTKGLDDLYRKKCVAQDEHDQCATACQHATLELGKCARGSKAHDTAHARSEEAQAKLSAAKSKVDTLEAQYQTMKRELDAAPQSREVKMTELQRMNQLRDNILNMVRSMMDTWSRNTEKVFR